MAEPHLVRPVLREFGIAARGTKRIQRGRNVHWIVSTSDGRAVLRRYASDVSAAEISYELDVIRHLARRGWPVPEPLAGPIGTSGATWCLFPYLPGRAPAPRSPSGVDAEHKRRGRLLARLHSDLATLVHLGQRPGWLRADEGLFDRAGRRPADSLFRAHEKRDADAARVLFEYYHEMQERLTGLLPSAPRPIVIHGDVVPWNMRYAAGRLSALFDFDFAHLDLRVADFALSWRGRHGGVLAGYHNESPLDDVERELIVPVYWAWMLWGAVDDLEYGNAPDWAIDHMLRVPLETRSVL